MFGLRVGSFDDACRPSRKPLFKNYCIHRVLNGRALDVSPNHQMIKDFVELGWFEARQQQNGRRNYPEARGLSKLGRIGSRLEVISCSRVWCDSYLFQRCWNIFGYKCK